ncbi:MAG: PspC domain-containing protein [Patescibacteria group bacterium]|nr:PspC domain-containing protein [Patescibacteria group bacterium]
MKKLYRSKENKVVSGVIGGIGEYFDVDPVILRLGWLLVLVMTAIIPGVIIYFIATFVVPKKR